MSNPNRNNKIDPVDVPELISGVATEGIDIVDIGGSILEGAGDLLGGVLDGISIDI